MKELKSSGIGSGLSEADRNLLKELNNETRDAITDMRLEVLTASDKSELNMNFVFKILFLYFFRFRKNSNPNQRNK